jgi:glycosyltransferase involved in cell wall biosynthesis
VVKILGTVSVPAEVLASASADSEDHHGSHRHLLRTPPAQGRHRARVDAIIVPTIRHPANLTDAAELAISLGCPLVTLHSGKWTSAQVAARRLPALTDLIAIDTPAIASLQRPAFKTSRILSRTRFERTTDTSAKRNFGLKLSRLVGWKRIVFLDDDIEVADPGDLEFAVGLLGNNNIVGLFVNGFPDNSVVCHAYRIAGGPQQSFIGGGAIAVDTERTSSFFPDIYNDDWFYMLDAEKGLQPVAATGSVIQRLYDPFHRPDRARAEEFGDVLAEGVFWLLDQGKTLPDADLRHWKDFLVRRKTFIERVLGLVNATDVEASEKRRMVAALKAARGRLAHITPELCCDYLQAWTADRKQWQRHIDRLPSNKSLESGLELLLGQRWDQLDVVIRRR